MRHAPHERLADVGVPGARLGRDPGCEVDGPSEVVALVVQHRARIDPDMRRRKATSRSALHDLEGSSNGIARIAEVEQHAVTEQLHGGPVVSRCDLAGQLRERQ